MDNVMHIIGDRNDKKQKNKTIGLDCLLAAH